MYIHFNPVTALPEMYPNEIMDLCTDVHYSIVSTCDKMLRTSMSINERFMK